MRNPEYVFLRPLMKHFLTVVALLILTLLVACSPSLPSVPAGDIVTRSGEAMLKVPSMHFKIDISGAPVYLNKSVSLSLRSVEGDFARPDQMGVHLKVIAAVAAAEMDMIALGNEQYVTSILTGKWEVLPPQFGFNPAIMFDPKVGIEQLLKSGLDDAQLMGVESIDGVNVYHVKGSLDGARVQGMSGGMIGTGRIEAELWSEGSTFVPRRAILIDTTSDPAKPSTWAMSFASFGKTVNITAPTIGQ
jgi:lipoprotein LprG